MRTRNPTSITVARLIRLESDTPDVERLMVGVFCVAAAAGLGLAALGSRRRKHHRLRQPQMI